MRFKLLFLLLLSVSFVNAQNDTFSNDIKYFIEINGTMGQYNTAVGELTNMLKEQYSSANVKESDWLEMHNVAVNSLEGLSDDLVTVYKKYFTHEEIKALNKMYDTKVAQKFINNVISISNASQDASIVWSRSLYNKITDLLHEKGYSK
ncbi:MAG TPA: DUF2059 domain-containing protein [Lutibacter sp.]|nr:DUF2059 domain-containing protein [Lutibacter sp.]